MKTINKLVLTHLNRTFEIRTLHDGAKFYVAGFEHGKKKTATYEVDDITTSDFIRQNGFSPYESLIGVVVSDITSGHVEK